MKNEAFQILLDSGCFAKRDLFEALESAECLELQGPWQGSDYSGDDVTESNQRSLARDYPQLLIDDTKYYGHCGYGLQIDPREFGKAEHREFAVALAKILAGLKYDYPLYDESDNSDLIHERAQEAWESYYRMDLEHEVRERTGLWLSLDDMEDAFWELCSEHEVYPEAEGHRDVILRGVGDPEFLDDLARAALDSLDWESSEPTEVGFEIVAKWMAEEYAIPESQLTLLVA